MNEGAIGASTGRNGFAKLLGTMMTQSGETFTLIPTEELVGNPILPALHGGAIASFLELAAQLALSRTLSPGQSCRLISWSGACCPGAPGPWAPPGTAAASTSRCSRRMPKASSETEPENCALRSWNSPSDNPPETRITPDIPDWFSGPISREQGCF